jgi:hypothetical protein
MRRARLEHGRFVRRRPFPIMFALATLVETGGMQDCCQWPIGWPERIRAPGGSRGLLAPGAVPPYASFDGVRERADLVQRELVATGVTPSDGRDERRRTVRSGTPLEGSQPDRRPRSRPQQRLPAPTPTWRDGRFVQPSRPVTREQRRRTLARSGHGLTRSGRRPWIRYRWATER